MKTLIASLLLISIITVAVYAQHTNNGATLTIETGLQLYSTNSLVNTGGGVINMNGGTLNITGNFTNNATFNAGSSTVNLNGGNQTIGGSSMTTFNDLSLSGSGIKTLSSNISVSGTLALNDRELNTGGNILTVTNTSASAVTYTSGFVSSTSGGGLARNTNATGFYVFPVGSSAGTVRYRPIQIEPQSVSTFSVRLANVDANTEGFNRSSVAGSIGGLNAAYFHVINRLAGSGPTHVTFYYPPGDGSFAGIARWGGSNWQEVPALPPISGSPFSRITAVDLSSFSPFILFSTGNAMTVPTLSEWGVLILSLLAFTLVALFLGRREVAVAGVNRSAGFYDLIAQAPFEKTGYFKILTICLLVAVIGFALIHIFIGTNGALDLAGTVICTVIVAYLIHLHKGFNKT